MPARESTGRALMGIMFNIKSEHNSHFGVVFLGTSKTFTYSDSLEHSTNNSKVLESCFFLSSLEGSMKDSSLLGTFHRGHD